MKKIAMIDLDGVLNTYAGKYNENIINPIRKGAKEFLKNLSKDFQIKIFTVRDKNLTQEWLIQNNISEYIVDITNIKDPRASIFLDDRGLNFNGNFKETLVKIQNFKPFWK